MIVLEVEMDTSTAGTRIKSTARARIDKAILDYETKWIEGFHPRRAEAMEWPPLSEKEKRPAFCTMLLAETGEQQEEGMYLFEVFVIDLKKQELLGKDYVICSDVPRATTVTALRLGLEENKLGDLKFHVHKICEVPAFDG